MSQLIGDIASPTAPYSNRPSAIRKDSGSIHLKEGSMNKNRMSTLDSGDISSISRITGNGQKSKRMQELRKSIKQLTMSQQKDLESKKELKILVDACIKICSDCLEILEHKEIPSAKDFEK
jgi:hypothetical protein